MNLTDTNANAQVFGNQNTLSGIPVPQVKKKKKKSWIGGLVFVVLIAGAYVFYWRQLNSPEIVFLRTIQAYGRLTSFQGNGKMEVDSFFNADYYEQLSEINLAQKNLFLKITKPRLKVNFDFAFDWSDPTAKKERILFDYNFFDPNNSNSSFLFQKEERYFPNKQYILVKNIPELDSGELLKSWVLNKTDGAKSNYQVDINLAKYETEPAEWVDNLILGYQLWKAKKALAKAGRFVFLPVENINGEETRHIKVEMKAEDIKLFLADLQVNLDFRVKEDLNRIKSVAFELWSSKKTHQPKKAIINIKAAGEKGRDESLMLAIELFGGLAGQIDEPKDIISQKDFNQHLVKLAEESEKQNLAGFEFMKSGKNLEAEPFLQRAIKSNVNNFRAYNSLGLINAQKGEFDKAVEYYKKSLAINPDHDKAAINIIYVYDAKNECAEQLGWAEDFIKKYLDSAFLYEAYWHISDANACLAKPEATIQASEIAIRLDSKNAWNFKIYYNLGLSYAMLKQSSQTLLNYQKSAELIKKHPELNVDAFTVGNVFVGLAREYYRAGKKADAKLAYLDAIQYDPTLKSDLALKQELTELGILK